MGGPHGPLLGKVGGPMGPESSHGAPWDPRDRMGPDRSGAPWAPTIVKRKMFFAAKPRFFFPENKMFS